MRQTRGKALGALMAAGTLAIALSACDSETVTEVEDGAGQSQQMQAFLDDPPRSDLRTQTGGAHRSGDPHARLDVDQLARVALQHLDESRPQLAIETLDEALLRFPRNAMLLSLRASVYMQTGQTSLALSDLNQAIDANPHDPVLLTNRAHGFVRRRAVEPGRGYRGFDLDAAIEVGQRCGVIFRFERQAAAVEVSRDETIVEFDGAVQVLARVFLAAELA